MKILKFSATWCGPCKTLAPIFEKVKNMEEFDEVSFQEFDVDDDDSAELIEKYSIRNVPTIMFVDENNEPTKRVVGSLSEQNLVQLIRDELANGE